MENADSNGLGTAASVQSVSAEAETSSPDSSQESTPTQQVQDRIKNLQSEMNRKISKSNNELKAELAEMKALLRQSHSQTPVDKTDSMEPDVKRYVDARFQEQSKDQVRKGQEEAWNKAQELFPELNQDSENFDEKFFKAADKFYGSFDLSRDPEAPLKAVKLAALEMGKIEQLTKEKLLKDEARRSRIIAEGASTPKENKKEKETPINEKALAKLGIKDTEKFKKRLKDEKYRE